MKHELVLRLASESDIPKLIQFAKSTFIFAYREDIDPEVLQIFTKKHFQNEKVKQEILSKVVRFLLLEKNSEIYGYAKILNQPVPSEEKSDPAIFIEKIYVKAGLKGKGLGTILLNEILSLAHEEDKTYIWLKVWEKNTEAQKFYHRHNFQKTGEMPFQMEWLEFNDYILKRPV